MSALKSYVGRIPAGLYFPIWSAAFLAAGVATAVSQPFWYDEIYTFTIARLSLPDILRALLTGTDLNPPGQYFTLSILYRLFGASEFMTRLPALLGFWLGCYCLFRYARKRAGPLWAILCPTVPAIAYIRLYATEGRPYGVLFGCAALAFWSWTERRRGLVALALAVAVTFHYYAVLIWIPLALAELSRRKWDLGMWVAFAAGALPLAAFLPLIQAAHRFSGFFWARPRLGLLGAFYWRMLGLPLIVATAVTLIVAREKRLAQVPREEIVAAVGFCLLFIFQYIVAISVTHAFSLNYGIPAIVGVALLAIHTSQWRRGWVALVACLAIFVFNTFSDVIHAAAGRYPDSVPREVRSLPGSLPLVVTTPHEFLEMDFYGYHDRVIWLSDPVRSMREWGNASDTVALLALSRWRPLHIEDYRAFLDRRQPFLVYGTGWVVRALAEEPNLRREQISKLCWRVIPR